MQNWLRKLLIIGILTGMLFSQHYSFAATDSIIITQQVTDSPVCNNDGTCDTWRGEDSTTCSADCTSTPVTPTPAEGGGIFIPPFVPKIFDDSLIINNGDEYTNNKKVTLNLRAEKAVQLAISNDSDFKNGVWEEYKTTKQWTLTNGNGEKIVYAKFRSNEGGETKVVVDKIILDTTPPANISDFLAEGQDKKINLQWKNPSTDFKGVKIMRSTDFYPMSPNEGQLVYNSSGEYYVDINVSNGTRYYYTAFVYDEAGNYSSGATTFATPRKPDEKITEIQPFLEDIMSQIEPPEQIAKLTPKDFNLTQGGKLIPFIDLDQTKFKAIYGEPLTISIPYEKFPEVLKTIMVTIEKQALIPDDSQGVIEKKSFSFLLRVNEDKTAYLATLIAPEPGNYPLKITILDYKNHSLKKITGELLVSPPAVPIVATPWYKKMLEKPYIIYIYIILITIILLTILENVFKRRRLKVQN
jgi:hypothetical protein